MGNRLSKTKARPGLGHLQAFGISTLTLIPKNNFPGIRVRVETGYRSNVAFHTGSSYVGGGYLYLNSIVLLSKSCIISIISLLEERENFSEDEAGHSISVKINILLPFSSRIRNQVILKIYVLIL